MDNKKWFTWGALVFILTSLYGQNIVPPPSPFGEENEGNISAFKPNQTTSMDIPTFSKSISPLLGITTMRSVIETNTTATMNLHVRRGINIPLTKNFKSQLWYQREIGEFELHNNQFRPNDGLNPAQHYLIKFFYQF